MNPGGMMMPALMPPPGMMTNIGMGGFSQPTGFNQGWWLDKQMIVIKHPYKS